MRYFRCRADSHVRGESRNVSYAHGKSLVDLYAYGVDLHGHRKSRIDLVSHLLICMRAVSHLLTWWLTYWFACALSHVLIWWLKCWCLCVDMYAHGESHSAKCQTSLFTYQQATSTKLCLYTDSVHTAQWTLSTSVIRNQSVNNAQRKSCLLWDP